MSNSVTPKKIASVRVIKAGSAPDVDSDFHTAHRDAVLEHCGEVYGQDKLSNIITFQTLAAKAAFKTMCTIYEVPFSQANKITALIPGPVEQKDISFVDIFNPQSSRYAEAADFRTAVAGEEWRQVLRGAQAIERRIRATGVHPCFTGDALVQTASGYKRIDEVEEGDLVLTHQNRLQPVMEVMRREAHDILFLKAANSAPVQVTRDHPFFVRSIVRGGPLSELREGSTRSLSEAHWKKAVDLEVKTDLIGVPINQNSIIPNFPGLPVEDADFWWLMGRFVGDGWHEEWPSVRNRVRSNGESYEYHRTEKRVRICYGKHEDADELLEKVSKFFTYRLLEERTVFKIDIKHDEIFFDFVKLFGKKATGKKVPSFVLDLPIDLLESFFLGYFSADGSAVPKQNMEAFSTVSKELFLGMIAVINKIYGVHCVTSVEPRSEMVIEGRTVQCNDRYHARWSLEKKVKDHSFVENGYVWASLTSSIEVEGSADVFNLSVLDDNSYTANNLIAHNCGVIISSKPLIETIPLQVRQSDGRVVSQWTYHDLEGMGLLKFDFLGLDTVDLISYAVENIMKNGKTPPNMVEIIHGPMDDRKTFELLGRGETDGIFQLASPGVKELLRRMKPTELGDIVATTALYRPGPMGMNSHIKYADRKNGRDKVEYPIHPDFKGSALEQILGSTYSLVVYQEQIMQIANQIGGMTLQQGDDLRSAMGKKKKDVMAKMKPIFLEGGVKNGYSEEAIQQLWATLEVFAEYGFNKAHSVAYAMNAYQSAYLKANYPVEFMAALISQNIGRKEKILGFLQEAKRMRLKVGSVDINLSDVRVAPDFTGSSDFDIVYGLSGINSVSEDMASIIVKERERGGDFKSVQDVVSRCSPKGVSNRKIYENLALAGAFDSFGHPRRGVVENLSAMLGEAKTQSTKGANLFDMLGGAATAPASVDLNSVDEYPHLEKLKKEAEVIGLFLTSHPLEHTGSLAGLRSTTIAQIMKSSGSGRYKLVGALTEIAVKRQKNGGKHVQIALDDGTAFLNASLSRDIVKGMDKGVSQAKIRNLYENGAAVIPDEIAAQALTSDFVAMEELETGQVYSVEMVFRPGQDETPYNARIHKITKIHLADDGSLPVRLRLSKPKTAQAKKEQVAFVRELAEKHPGTSPLYVAYKESGSSTDLDGPFRDAVDYLDAHGAAEVAAVLPAEAESREETALTGQVTKQVKPGKKGKKADDGALTRVWPPPKQDRGPLVPIEIEDSAKLFESLTYKPTKFMVGKSPALGKMIEFKLGIENFDFGVFNPDLLEDNR